MENEDNLPTLYDVLMVNVRNLMRINRSDSVTNVFLIEMLNDLDPEVRYLARKVYAVRRRASQAAYRKLLSNY